MYPFEKHIIYVNRNVREALKQLDDLASDAILFAINDNEELVGSLTDGDIRRGLLRNNSLELNVADLIQPNPRFLRKEDYSLDEIIQFRQGGFRMLPVINEENKIVNVINLRKLKSYLPVDAVIMAGGKGSRLMPLTADTPKPLLKVGAKAIIEHNIDRLALFGIDDFWITINYLGDQLVNYLGNGREKGINVSYVNEPEALGTIGSMSLINDLCHDYILLTNSDILTNLDYEHFFLNFIQSDADLSVVTIPYKVDIPYAVLETSSTGNIIDFKEKPTYTYYSNGGIYLMKREVVEMIPKSSFYNATDLMEEMIKKGMRVTSFPLTGYWLDIGKHDDFNKAQEDINKIRF